MKRMLIGCLVFCLLALVSSACAEVTPLPESVKALCEATYPGYVVSAQSGGGNENRGQIALVLSRNNKHILCIAEKNEADAAYRFSVANDKALRDSERVPSVLIDTGGDSLFFRCIDGQDAYSYHAVKNADGQWGEVDLIRQDTVNFDETGFAVMDGLLWMVAYREDREGNILSREAYVPVPAPWLADCLALNQFDTMKFPRDRFEAMDLGGKHAAGALLLPKGAVIVDGGVAPIALSLLVDLPDGTRRLFLCTKPDGQDWQIIQSSPLPTNAYIDIFHAWSNIIVGWTEGENQLSYGVNQWFDGRWLISYAMATEWFAMNENFIKDQNAGLTYYGTFPDIDLRTVDWQGLPRTLSEALAKLDIDGWARVTSDDPTKRLHLRVSPKKDAESLGKYYGGVPVRVLEEQGDWAHVIVGGIEGWMMKEFLAFGANMPSVPSYSPQLFFREELRTEDLCVYAQPNENATAIAVPKVGGPKILGVVGDTWFHVLFEETGESGYMKQDWFWPGNG